MLASARVGLMLESAEELGLLRRAALACGMEPVDLVSAELQVHARARWAATGPGTRLLVTDRLAGELDGPLSASTFFHDNDAFTIHLRTQPQSTITPVPTGTSSETQDPWLQVGQDDSVWVLYRPVRMDEACARLRLAAQLCERIEERTRSLATELHRIRHILDSMCNGVTVSDLNQPDMPLVYVNPAFERMTGYTSAEVCGRNCRFLQGPERDQPALDKVRLALRERRSLRALLRNFRKDGTPFWNELYMSPMFDLEGRLSHFVGFQNDVTERVESALRIEHLANHDPLTGLANRSLIMEQLKRALPRAARNRSNAAVLFLDLNQFKAVNDLFGHEAGDALLREVAVRLVDATREGDPVGRIGGDEFVVLLEDISDEAVASQVMKRVETRLSEAYDLGGSPYHPSASIGMALFPRDGETPEALLKAADTRMYRLKNEFHHAAEAFPMHVDRRG